MSSRERAGFAVVVAISSVVLVYGWHRFWFLTDDAYIAFRYVSNSMLGLGYVWNAPPFRPVEGYTSFLWVALLDFVWRVLGVDPPRSANFISLGFSFLTLGVTAALTYRSQWQSSLRPYRVLFTGVVLIGVLTNRTFLAWTSSGLETAMFNFFVLSWVLACYSVRESNRPGQFIRAGLCATFAALTRPDGLLLVAGTMAIIAAATVVYWKNRRRRWQTLLSYFSFAPIAVHLAWRRSRYGEWLPNTYYAKTNQGSAWRLGVEYLTSFVLEYALWIWLLVAIAAAIHCLRVRRTSKTAHSEDLSGGLRRIARAICIIVLLAQAAYYVLKVGGDHFEYRVFSHFVVLIFVTYAALLNRLSLKPWAAVSCFAFFIACSWVIPWTHWAASQSATTRATTQHMKLSVANTVGNAFPMMPNWVLTYMRYYDSLQFDLIDHLSCVRHQTHKVYLEYLQQFLPTREEGERISSQDFPVMRSLTVGYRGWVLPHVNIIDELGLNDYVVARLGRQKDLGKIAHDRRAPPQYVECFAPNISENWALRAAAQNGERIDPAAPRVLQIEREQELTDDAICACEDSAAREYGIKVFVRSRD